MLQRDVASDEARAREVYQYFRPPVNGAAPLDTVLTAHAQLVAWRLDAGRAMVSLIDEDTQYFVAESTKTLHLDDTLQYDHPDDAVWAGCTSVPKAGRLCEHTIAAPLPLDGGQPYFEVMDLSKDDRFNTLEFVVDGPRFKTYVGVPLRTRKGVNIGSLFILDSNVRGTLTHTERQFLGVMANNVMQHLETIKEKKERERTNQMNTCLSIYVDPEFQDATHLSHSDSRTLDPASSPEHTADGSGRLSVLRRGAEILRTGLGLEEDGDGGGGVIFLDTLSSSSHDRLFRTGSDEKNTTSGQNEQEESSRPVQQGRATTILAHASSETSDPSRHDHQGITTLSQQHLQNLISCYPRGKLFTFDKNGEVVASPSSEKLSFWKLPESNTSGELERRKFAASDLRTHFPTARQIIFLPLWDSVISRPSACFIYNCSDHRNFSYGSDFLYCIIFSNCIMARVAELSMRRIDKQKNDFIGSISHELRSPLHGILGSCEFLVETECTTFQRALVDTTNNCAKMLLGTVDMILDYSNINALEESMNAAGVSQGEFARTDKSSFLQSSLSVDQDVDLVSITEDAIQVAAVGHFFDDSLIGPYESELTHDNTREKGSRPGRTSISDRAKVNIVVDIPLSDWSFRTRPGALQRIIVNLVSNALKHTAQGSVRVQLETQPTGISASTVPENITLTVSDSGQGMSMAYMENDMFVPFSQESNLSSGTGLGLSLVKSLVAMLDGEIHVESSVGVGTKVIVRLPLLRKTPNSSGIESSSSLSLSSNLLELVRSQARDMALAVCWDESPTVSKNQSEAVCLLRKSLTWTLSEWFGFKVNKWHEGSIFDIIISEEGSLDALELAAPHLFTSGSHTILLVLRNFGSVKGSRTTWAGHDNIEEVHHPIGPYKLARALKRCFERIRIGKDSHLGKSEIPSEGISQDSVQPNDEVTGPIQSLTTVLPRELDDPTIPETKDLAFGQDHMRISMVPDDAGLVEAPTGSSDVGGAPQIVTLHPSMDGELTPNRNPMERAIWDPPVLPKNLAIDTNVQEREVCNVAGREAMDTQRTLLGGTKTLSSSLECLPSLLLVDDNMINLKLLQTFAKKHGYPTTTSAQNGLQAVDAFRELINQRPSRPPDIILMDLSMPIMNGFEATRRIRAIETEHTRTLAPPRSTKPCLIIALSGLASVKDQRDAFASGVDMYMMKPASFFEISRLLDDWKANSCTDIA